MKKRLGRKSKDYHKNKLFHEENKNKIVGKI